MRPTEGSPSPYCSTSEGSPAEDDARRGADQGWRVAWWEQGPELALPAEWHEIECIHPTSTPCVSTFFASARLPSSASTEASCDRCVAASQAAVDCCACCSVLLPLPPPAAPSAPPALKPRGDHKSGHATASGRQAALKPPDSTRRAAIAAPGLLLQLNCLRRADAARLMILAVQLHEISCALAGSPWVGITRLAAAASSSAALVKQAKECTLYI
jgi:hypothetical protein